MLLSYLCLIVLKRERLASIALLPLRLVSLPLLRSPPLPCLIEGYSVICVGITPSAVGSHSFRNFHHISLLRGVDLRARVASGILRLDALLDDRDGPDYHNAT